MTCSSLEAFKMTWLIFLLWNNIIFSAFSSSPPTHRGFAGYCVQTHPKVNANNEGQWWAGCSHCPADRFPWGMCSIRMMLRHFRMNHLHTEQQDQSLDWKGDKEWARVGGLIQKWCFLVSILVYGVFNRETSVPWPQTDNGLEKQTMRLNNSNYEELRI